MPTVNIPAKVRFALYLIGALATPLVAYLFESKVIGKEEVTLFGAYIALIAGLAATKTSVQ
jgi:hypothetical protein